MLHIAWKTPGQPIFPADTSIGIARDDQIEFWFRNFRLLYRDWEFDESLVHIVDQFKIVELQIEERLICYFHSWQCSRFSLQLFLQSIEMIEIDVGVAKCVCDIPGVSLHSFATMSIKRA